MIQSYFCILFFLRFLWYRIYNCDLAQESLYFWMCQKEHWVGWTCLRAIMVVDRAVGRTLPALLHCCWPHIGLEPAGEDPAVGHADTHSAEGPLYHGTLKGCGPSASVHQRQCWVLPYPQGCSALQQRLGWLWHEVFYSLHLGQIEVSCEGCDYTDDPYYILRGSCSLLFRLNMTEDGEKIAQDNQSTQDSSDSGAGAFFVIVLWDYWS